MLRKVLVTPDTAEHKRITALLPEIFPKEELVPPGISVEPLPYLCFYEDEDFIGFAQVLKKPDLHYLSYMAILPQHRSKGYGGQMLELILAERCNTPLALDIEVPDEKAPNAEQRIRRLRFYQKHGLIDSGYQFVFGGVPYSILSTGEECVPEKMKKYCEERKDYEPGFLQIVKCP